MKTKTHQDILVGFFWVLFCAVFLLISISKQSDSFVFPILLLAVLALLAAWVIWDGFRKTKAATASQVSPKNTLTPQQLKAPVLTYLYIAAYVVLFNLVGYYIATFVFMVALMRYFRIVSWKQILLVTVIFILFIYFLLVRQLNVPLGFGYLELLFAGL